MMSFVVKLGLCVTACAAVPAGAVGLLYQGTDDNAYEGAAGWLATTYGLPVPPGNNGNVVLPPLERAVGEVRIGRANTSERTRALHVPTVGSGLPAPAGSGVINALTNYNPVSSANTAIVAGDLLSFSVSRIGSTITYAVGNWTGSFTNAWNSDINAFQVRTRGGNIGASLKIADLSYTPAGGVAQALGDWQSADGGVQIALFGGVAGDFTLTGNYLFNWNAGSRPGGSALASQIKLLDLPERIPATVPEPATWAMMIIGFGLVGGVVRRDRRTVALHTR